MSRFLEFINHWSFGLILGLGYVAVFNLWHVLGRNGVVFSSVAASGLLLAILAVAARRNYFLNRWDAFLHVLVILDILLEGMLLREHPARDFYLCALAFAVVIAGYRVYLRKRAQPTK